MLADAGATNGDDADLLIGPIAELLAQRLTVGEVARIEPGDIAAEVVVALGPGANLGQIVAEGVEDDIIRIANKDGAVAQPREALDVLDHLGVIVGGEKR